MLVHLVISVMMVMMMMMVEVVVCSGGPHCVHV